LPKRIHLRLTGLIPHKLVKQVGSTDPYAKLNWNRRRTRTKDDMGNVAGVTNKPVTKRAEWANSFHDFFPNSIHATTPTTSHVVQLKVVGAPTVIGLAVVVITEFIGITGRTTPPTC
jgi:hypothetical protein